MHVYQASPSSHDSHSSGGQSATDEVSRSARELSAESLARVTAYAVLGALLVKPPSNDLLSAALPASADLVSEAGDVAQGWRALVKARGSSESPRYSDVALDDEYHDLFIGVVRGEVMPYGSWYMSGFLMDKPLAALRDDLDALGFERVRGVAEPEDHAGALCETMAMIIQAEDISERAEKTFFDRHMRPWMSLFFKDLDKAKSADFYRNVADFGQRFITFEKAYFEI